LAKAEIRQAANRTGQAVGMFAGAAIAAFLVILFLSLALWVAISDRTGPGWGAVIVAAIWLVAGAVLYAVARSQMKKIEGLPQTTETVRQVPNALKGQEERNR
jgi:outer membrane lipoprotein SlyB